MASGIYDPRLLARVEFILKRQIDIATQEHYKAKAEFWQITAEPGIGDERQLIDIDRRCAVARNALSTAFQRFNDFILKGTVPEDLQRREQVGERPRGSSFI